jgi:hypothetical protein
VQAQEGAWWITQSGRAADIILQPGERVSFGAYGLLLVEPLPGGAAGCAPSVEDRSRAERHADCLKLPCCQLAISRRYFDAELRAQHRWENISCALLWASSVIALVMFVHGIF